jgi:AAA domain, putative AbiEii toxin, Type IV TA system/AAA ATPase domain
MLRELTIENYRCFEKLHVKDLAQVNLIVGKNNVGKTSFLEAIYLYVSGGDPRCLLELLSARELTYEPKSQSGNLTSPNEYQLGDIFNLARQNKYSKFLIRSDSAMQLCFQIEKPDMQFQFGRLKIDYRPINSEKMYGGWGSIDLDFKDDFIIDSTGFSDKHGTLLLEGFRNVQGNAPYHFVEARGLGFETLRKLWEQVNLTPEEDAVETAMRLLEPRVERIGFTTNRQPSIGSIKVRLKDESTPVPLSSLGDGMRRILGLAMSLAVSKSGYLVIDEIDMGLHYKAQYSMWKLVLETAKRLNVQVFASTHSWDCIAAFQAALAEMEDQSIGKLFRIDARGDEVRAIEYDAEDLEVVVAQGIEVR